MENYRVMFVCLGNICRSPVAHAVFEHMVKDEGLEDRILIESSGTGAWHVGEQADERMRRTARHHNVVVDHRARKLDRQDLEDYDLILAMDSNNFRDINHLLRDESLRGKIRLFRDFDPQGPGDVPDPYYGGRDGFEEVFHIVHRTCRALLEHLKAELAA